ncbi:MAG: polysaccharide deacetylase family protein [Parvularculaceae bacterium]|nr:polysaccharide deacetylase family protein [Parvularculaceae bacterium]
MDNPYYGWDPVDRREKVLLSDGTKATATIIVPLEFFPLNPPAKPFKHPGAMKTQYPDLRHYTVRDYGNRVGVFRLLKLFAATGVQATFAVNAEVARRYPPLLEAIREAGHEIAAHGVSTSHIHHEGLGIDEERDWIAQCRDVFPDATSWMSPARNESTRTVGLLAEAGFTTCLDWEADMRPHPLATEGGNVTAIPHYNELSDMKLLMDRSQSEDTWAKQITDAAEDHLLRHDQEGAGAFAFTLTPYVAGQPFRIHAVKAVLRALSSMEGLKVATAADVNTLFAEHLA